MTTRITKFFAASGRCLSKQRSVVIVNHAMLTALSFVLLVAAFSGAVAFKFCPPPDLELLKIQFCESAHVNLRPEPVERIAYLSAVFAIFPIMIGAVSFYSKRMVRIDSILPIFISLSMLVFIYLTYCKSNFFAMVIGGEFEGFLHTGIGNATVVAVFASIIYFVTYIRYGANAAWMRRRIPYRDLFIYFGFGMVGIVCIGLARVRSAEMLYGDGHFEAVFYCVSQVAAGKTILSELTAQYGFYAEVLSLFFRNSSISVLEFTVVMATLQSVVVILLILIVSKILRNPVFRILCMFSLFLLVGTTWRSLHLSLAGNELFQLWPLRILFPVVTIAVFLWGDANKMKLFHILVLGILAGVAIVWNLESGVASYGALVASFLIQSLFCHSSLRGKTWAKFVLMATIPLICVFIFAVYLMSKAGSSLPFLDVIKYQATFYKLGFGMLPLPTAPHPWMLVLLVYLYGIVFSVVAQVRSAADRVSKVMLILSVIGIGLFTYYQGRSHDIVLSIVMWPAIIVSFILLEKTLRSARLKLISPFSASPVIAILVFGLLSTYSLVSSASHLFSSSFGLLSIAVASPDDKSPIDAKYSRIGHLVRLEERRSAFNIDSEFVRGKMGDDKTAAILSPGQGVLFAENGIASAVPGPGLVETLLAADRRRFYSFLLETSTNHVFIQSDSEGELPDVSEVLLRKYRVTDRSSNNLLYLQPFGFN